MADGSVSISIVADDADAQKKLSQLRKEIEKTEKTINSTTEKRNGITESLSQAREEAEQTAQKIQEIKNQMSENQQVTSGMKGDIDVEEFNARNQAQKEMTYEIKQQEAIYARQAANVAKLEGQEANLTRQLEAQTSQLNAQKGEAGEVERALAIQSERTIPNISAAISEVNSNLKKGFKNILKWGFGIRSAFILMRRLRSAIKEGIKAFAEYDEETKTNISNLKGSLSTLKAAWGGAFAPILNTVAPLLQQLIAWLIKAANAVNAFFSALNGRGSYKKIIQGNEELANSYEAAGSAAGGAKKQVMKFDELNKLDDGGGGGGGGAKAFEGEETEVPDKISKIVGYIQDNIALLETILGDSMLVLGAILLFTWTKPILGLGLIAAGIAMKGGVAANWEALPEQMKRTIMNIDLILGGALLAIGAIIAFAVPGQVGLGIGLMIAGSAMLGSAVALNWDYLKDMVSNNLADILAIAGAALFVIGAIIALSCPPLLGLGIGLMIAGGASLLAGGIMSIDWNKLKNKIASVVDGIKSVLDGLKSKWEELKAAAGELKNKVVEKFNGMVNSVRDKVAKFKEFGSNIVQGIRDGIRNKWNDFTDFFSGLWDRLREWWDGLSLGAFHIPAPHFEWSYSEASGLIARALEFVGLPATIPHLNISWYARGGIVDGATLIGAGERGKEAIVPLERNTEWINMVADGLISRLATSPVLNGSLVPPRAVGSGNALSDSDIDRLVNGIVSAFTTTEEDRSTKLYLDGKVIAEAVTKYQRRAERGFA